MTQTDPTTEVASERAATSGIVPAPSDLAQLLPLGPNDAVFTIAANLDSTYVDGDTAAFTGAVDLSQLPQLVYRKLMRTGGDYATVGVSVYAEGIDVVYQSFFWTDATPQAGVLQQDAGKYKASSAPVRLNNANPLDAFCQLTPYPWCNVTASPVITTWDMGLGPGTVKMDDPTFDQSAIQVVGYRNSNPPGTAPVEFTATHQWQYAVNAQATVTNVISVKAGLELKWSYKVGNGLGGATWEVKVSLETTYSRTMSKTTQKTTTLTDISSAKMSLAPGQTSYLVTVAEVDTNATGTIALSGSIAGTVNGQTLTSDYLAELLRAMYSQVVITSTTDTSVSYNIVGTVSANVLGSVSSEVTDTPPPGIPIIWGPTPDQS